MNYLDYHSQKNEKYISFLVNDIGHLYTQFFENIIYLVNSIVMLLAYTVILACVSWQLCLVIIGSLLLIIFVPQLVGRKFNLLNTSLSNYQADYLSRCEEILAAHDLIDASNQERFCTLHNSQLKKMQDAEYSLVKYRSFVQVFSGSALYLQLILCFVAGVLFSYYDIISLGTFAASLLYVEFVAQYSANIVDEFLEIRSANTYCTRCLELLNSSADIYLGSDEPIHSIRLDSVSYKINEKAIIQSVSYEFEAGKKYLITGANGTGKSTLLKMIAGIVEPTCGQVLYNNSLEHNFNELSYIPQSRYVFEGTLLENITLFKSNVTTEEIRRISSMCTVVNLKQPMDYQIARNGHNLSGGEVAKICLIRELYRNRSILLIDEPFNDVDNESEKEIFNFLIGLNQTVILVAHGKIDSHVFDKHLIVSDSKLNEANP